MSKQLVTISLILLLIIAVGAIWFGPQIASYNVYKTSVQKQEEEFGEPFTVKPIENTLQVELATIESTWQRQTGGEELMPTSDALKSLNYPANIEGLIKLCNFRLPSFNWFNGEENVNNMVIGATQMILQPITIDNAIYVSKEDRLAFIRPAKGMVIIYRETDNGLKEERWVNPTIRKKTEDPKVKQDD